ncbi:ubiquitin carboxyl-terminal hydrolase 4 [Striga asiatica]|uniref:Ubiquitin carboxyl-terminal hydrolase 4 n=1 Tax=Striga asiatica TaxID=4170 RepID=A0A5A7P5Y0_STRAF|nr:ubiquitin carboxyl-terminal hydrolase 4 [Striga asiatica]
MMVVGEALMRDLKLVVRKQLRWEEGRWLQKTRDWLAAILSVSILLFVPMAVTKARKRKWIHKYGKFSVPIKGWSSAYEESRLNPNEGTVPLRRSSRKKFKVDRFGGGEVTSSREDKKPATRRKQRMPTDPKEYFLARGNQSAEIALSCYNQKHGTNLEFMRFVDFKEREFFGPGYLLNFDDKYSMWRHVNFEARPPNDKPLLMFAELYKTNDKYELTTLSLVNPSHDGQCYYLCATEYLVAGFSVMWSDAFLHVLCLALLLTSFSIFVHDCACPSCDISSVIHPLHGFRAGFVASEPSEPKIMSKEDAVKLAEFALKDYNDKNVFLFPSTPFFTPPQYGPHNHSLPGFQGTTLKIERALECNSFTSSGPLMDFTVKTKRWVHMNFEVKVGPKEEILRLFAELYLSDDNTTYVLASLSATSPSELFWKWKKRYNIDIGCPNCPKSIYHPWLGFRHAFNCIPTIPSLAAKFIKQ